MSLLYEVKLFLRFAQLVGGFPYRLTTDHTKKLISLSFSWRSMSLVWFIIITFMQSLSPIVVFQFFSGYVKGQITTSNLVFRTCSLGSLFILMVSSRWVVCQPKKWSTIIETCTTIEKSLANELAIAGINIKFYCYSAIIVAVTLVSSVAFATKPIYNEIFTAFGGAALGISVFVHVTFYLNVSSSIMLIYATCLITGKYIDAMSLKITCHDGLFLRVTEKEVTDVTLKFERTRILINTLCNSFKDLKSLFSFPLFLILIEGLMNVVILSYIFTYSFIKPTMYFYSIRTTMGVVMTFNVILILTVLYASEIPVEKNLKESIAGSSTTPLVTSSTVQRLMNDVRASVLLLQLDDGRFRLTAMGLFDIGLHLVPAMTGAAVTYLVILIQQVQE